MSNTPCYMSSSQWLWMKVQIINDNTVHPDSHSCVSSHILTHALFDAHFKSTSNTNLVHSSDVQVVFFKGKLYHFSLAFLGCPVEHGETFVVSAMQQGLHLGGQAPNGTGMTTLCCKVQSVLSVLWKGMHILTVATEYCVKLTKCLKHPVMVIDCFLLCWCSNVCQGYFITEYMSGTGSGHHDCI